MPKASGLMVSVEEHTDYARFVRAALDHRFTRQ